MLLRNHPPAHQPDRVAPVHAPTEAVDGLFRGASFCKIAPAATTVFVRST